MNTLIPATLVLSLSLAPAQSVEVPALPENVIQLFKMEEDVSRHQLLLFTACVQMKNKEFPALKRQNWEISESESSHIRIIDVDQHAALTQKFNVQSLPTLILMVDGKEVSRSGSLNAYSIAEMFYNGK